MSLSISSQIVLDWANSILNTDPKITEIKESFSNGYLYGKILYNSNLIKSEEFSEFIDTDNIADINSNFLLIEKYCKKLFKMVLFESEISKIKQKDISAGAVLLYKIRNNIYKLKIHFNEIQFFGKSFSNDEIGEQIRDLIKKQLGDESEQNDDININKNFVFKEDKSDINKIKEEKEENIEENKDNKKIFQKNMLPLISKKSININSNITSNITNDTDNKLEIKKNKYENIFIKSNNINSINNTKLNNKPKNILMPIKHHALKKKSNSTENIFYKNKSRNLLNTNDTFLPLDSRTQIDENNKGTFSLGINFNNSFLINASYFNKKLEDLGITEKNYKIKESNINNLNNPMNTVYMKSIDEIRNELKNKFIEKNKTKDIKKIVRKDNINFLKVDKNYLNKNKPMNLYFKEYNNLNSLRRINYSKELSKRKEDKIIEQKQILADEIRNQISTHSTLPQLSAFRNTNINTLTIFDKKDTLGEKFSSNEFFETMSYLDYNSFNNQCKNKYMKKRIISKKIKEIVLYIIDMAFEGYLYQIQNECEIMDLRTFLKFNIYFLKNKRLRKRFIIKEDNIYKRPGKIDQVIDFEKIYNSFTFEEKNLIEDYIYYLGIWNDNLIFDKNFKGIKLDYKYIISALNYKRNSLIINHKNNNHAYLNEYEPTFLENEDITIPSEVPDNYNLGNLYQEIFSQHYNLKNNNDINNTINKWDYIPYKISLIGYPLSGRKSLAKKIINIYPNLKIYSIRKIINYYFDLYLKYSDPIEIPQTEKSVKKKGKKEEIKEKNVKINTIDKEKEKESIFEKEERHKKLREMKPIFDALQPYINYKLYNNKNNDNINSKDMCILPDESLCLLLVKKVEEDFPIANQQKIIKNIFERQKNKKEIMTQIETIKKKKEDIIHNSNNNKNQNKGNKDDIQIEKLENEIKNIKIKSITGFILVDYPNNLNQCLLLENYLTGFVEEKRKIKSDKNIIITKTNKILDYNYQPKEKIMDKKSGLNFIINIHTKKDIINSRFETAKYDPIEKILYTGDNINIQDKAIKERLINKIPYLPKNLFVYYKDEYYNNINKIINLYSEFISPIKTKKDENDFFEKNNEKLIKTYHYIESENIKDYYNLNIVDKKTKKKNKKEENKDANENNNNTSSINNEDSIRDKAFEFICKNLIEKLFKKREEYEEEIYNDELNNMNSVNNANNKNKKNEKINKITFFEPDLNISEIKTKYKIRSPKKSTGNLKIIDYDINKIDLIIQNLLSINSKYYNHIGVFIHLVLLQKKEIYEKLNLQQKKFRDNLNQKSPKKNTIISNYVNKYNHLYALNPNYIINNETVIEQLTSDIEDIRTEIWNIINKKQNDFIEELNEVKQCGFIEVEMIKFYNNIKNLLLIETEKFITIFNDMLILFNKFKEKDKNKIIISINEFKRKLITNPSVIFRGTKEIKYHSNRKNDSIVDIPLDQVIPLILENIEIIFKNCVVMLFSYHDILSSVFQKVKKSFFVSNSVIKKSFRVRKKKRKNSEKKLLSVSMMNDLLTNKDSNFSEKTVKKIFFEEKNKYKYRLYYIKNFAKKYIEIIKYTSENVYENMDDWIVKNVTLQSESLNYILSILKNFLFHDKKLIDKESDIDFIELDEFEKVIDDNDKNDNNNTNNDTINNNNKNKSNIKNYNNSLDISKSGSFNGSGTIENEYKLKPFNNSSVIHTRIYNKINLNYLITGNLIESKLEEYCDLNNINNNHNKKVKTKVKIKVIPPANINNLKDEDFYFDIEKFKFVYKLIKKYETEDGYINKDIFFEIFIRQYLISKKKLILQKRKKTEDSSDSDNNTETDPNINNIYNKLNIINNINDDIITFPIICSALKKLTTKQLKKINDYFTININKLKYIKEISIENINKDSKEKDIRKSNRKKTTKKINNIKKLTAIKSKDKSDNKNTLNTSDTKNNKSATNINNTNDIVSANKEKEKKENNDYNIYLNTKEIFTIIILMGVNVLTKENEEKIEKEITNKLYMNKYLYKKDFMEYIFWFEDFFEYYTSYKNGSEVHGNIIIKEFLFNLWKIDENSEYFDFIKFFDALKINKYITENADFNQLRYYDIIFS